MSILLNPTVCPNGPLGNTIIKPVSWRVLNDNKRFVNDWDNFVCKWKRWKFNHPITLLDNYLWEQEKNRIRWLWFDLTGSQRQRLKDIRIETGIKIVEMKPFNGFKYQRGFLSGGGVKRQAWKSEGSGSVLSLDAANNSAFNIDVSPPGALDAGFGCLRDGTLDRVNSAGQLQINSATDWITPRTSTVGDGWEVKWNAIINGTAINDENFTEDVWTTISVTGIGRYVGQLTSGPSSGSTFEFDIGEDGTSTSDVNQDYSVEAGDLI